MDVTLLFVTLAGHNHFENLQFLVTEEKNPPFFQPSGVIL